MALQFTFGLVFSWGAVAPDARSAGWPPLLVGAVFAAVPLGYGSGTVVGGRLSDRLPPRRLCWVALGLLAVGFAVTFAQPAGATFVLFYSLLGLGFGGGIALAASLAAGIGVLPGRAGLVGGALTATYALGAVVEVPVVARLAAAVGWVDALRLVGTALVLMAALALTLMPSLPPPSRSLGELRAGLGEVLRRRLVWTALLIEAAIPPLGAYAYVNLNGFVRERGIAIAVGTAALVTLSVGNAAGRVLAGLAADRAGPDSVLLAILAFALAGAAVLWWTPGAAAVLAAAAFAGLAMGGGAGVLSSVAAEGAPDAPGTAFGLCFAGYAAGACCGPLLGALLGSAPQAWPVLGSLPLAGLGLLALRAVWRSPAREAGLPAA